MIQYLAYRLIGVCHFDIRARRAMQEVLNIFDLIVVDLE